MSEMSFMPQLVDFLISNKRIFTVRRYKMNTLPVFVPGVGRCMRNYLGEVSSLEPYYKESGFSSMEEWMEKIRYFIPNKKDKMYLYRVEVLD